MGQQCKSSVLDPGRYVYTWYGINGSSGGEAYIPCRRFPPDGKTTGPLTKITDIHKQSELVFMFDGIGINFQGVNANRVNARHNKQSITNILFFDSHAESFYTKSLPGGDGDANQPGGAATTFGLANLANYPFPLWRMDQCTSRRPPSPAPKVPRARQTRPFNAAGAVNARSGSSLIV